MSRPPRSPYQLRKRRTGRRFLGNWIGLSLLLAAAYGLTYGAHVLVWTLGVPDSSTTIPRAPLTPDHYRSLLVIAVCLSISSLLLNRSLLLAIFLVAIHAGHVLSKTGLLLTPAHLIRWWPYALKADITSTLLQKIGIVTFGVALLLIGGFAYGALRRREHHGHGSSRWAEPEDMTAAAVLPPHRTHDGGPVVGGRLEGPIEAFLNWRYRNPRVIPLLLTGDRYLLVFSPAGGGKTTAVIIPTLLHTTHASAIVVDPKAELFEATAGYRQEKGHRILRWDTSGQKHLTRYNPLTSVPRDEGDAAAAQRIARAIVHATGDQVQKNGQVWDNAAKGFLVSLILHAIYTRKDPALPDVRAMFEDQLDRDRLLAEMILTEHDPEGVREWVDAEGSPTTVHPEVRRGAAVLWTASDRTRSSVFFTISAALAVLADPALARSIARTDFDVADFLIDDAPTTLYLTVPQQDMERASSVVGLLLREMLDRITEVDQNARNHDLYLVLEELPQLGPLQFLERFAALLRGYGVRFIFVVQSLRQIRRYYSQDESLSTNSQAMVSLGANDNETAELLSKMTGPTTVQDDSISVGDGATGSVSQGERDYQRPLLTPDEVRSLNPEDMLTFVQGAPPHLGQKPYFFNDPQAMEATRLPPPRDLSNQPQSRPVLQGGLGVRPTPHAIDAFVKARGETSNDIEPGVFAPTETVLAQAHHASITSLFSLHDGTIVSGAAGGAISLWDPASRSHLTNLDGAHNGTVRAFASTPMGTLLTSDAKGTLFEWDEDLPQPLPPLGSPIFDLLQLPDGLLLVACGDGTVQRLNGSKLLEPAYESHDGAVRALAHLPNGDVASAGADRKIRVWNPHHLGPGAELRGHTKVITALAIVGTFLVSGADDKTVRVWDLEIGEQLADMRRTGGAGHKRSVTALLPLSDTLVLSAGADGLICCWDLHTSAAAHVADFDGYAVGSMCRCPSGELAVGLSNGSLHILPASLLAH